MQRNIIRIVVQTCFMIAWTATVALAGDDAVVLIGHKNVPAKLLKEEVKQIFLGNKTRWADDAKITFVILNDKETYKLFLKDYVGRTYPQYQNYWKQQVFNGKGRMPLAFKDPAELIDFLAHTPGSIGFARSDDVSPDQVNILTVE